MTDPWFYAEVLPPGAGQELVLRTEEARHARSARRLEPGATVTLFDGSGRCARATLLSMDKGSAEAVVRVVDLIDVPEPEPRVILASALPKGDRLSTLLDMATQLGMHAFMPLACHRSIVTWSPTRLDRFQRIVLEACKQSRRGWVPRFMKEATPRTCFEQLPTDVHVLLCDPSGQTIHEFIEHVQKPRTHLAVIVGPEGGFDETEQALLEEGSDGVLALGTGTLRIETACLAALAQACLVRAETA